jgi:magnesium chelatase family protein
MMAKRLVTLMPPLTEDEAIEATQIHSVAGTLDPSEGFLATRPFRSPHHTISDAGLLGGSSHPSPGEVSLAHHGILFLDELPEFRRSTLEVMRQPLEDGRVTISRAAGTYTFPSRFLLVAAMNPCPCGYLGDPRKECQCGPAQIDRYRSKISGPLLDRIDLQVEVPSVAYGDLRRDEPAESSSSIRERVLKMREIQRRRFVAYPGVTTNAQMDAAELRTFRQAADEPAEAAVRV